MKTVVVIGGGITGLSSMHYLQKLKNEQDLDMRLILVEKNQFLGGKINSVEQDGFIMETGADSIVARHESVMPLIEELHLQNEVAYNATGVSFIYKEGQLHAIPADSIFGIPMSKESLFSSTLVSEGGKQEALKDFETKNEHFTLESSVGEFLEYFFGKELVEEQIAPVLSGVYSGELNTLTLGSTLPYLLEYKNKYGSIIKGLSMNKEKFQSSKPKFLTFKNGLSSIIHKLEEELKEVEIIKGVTTTKVMKRESGYEIQFSNHDSIVADYVVTAIPHDVTQDILQSTELNEEFDQLKNSSLISVYLGFDVSDRNLPEDGTGFIVPDHHELQCDACTWTSRKWSHTSKEGNLLVRLFYKSSNPSYEKLKTLNEEHILSQAMSDIEKSIGITNQPKVVEITHWNENMPNYHLGHGQTVSKLDQKMKSLFPNVILAGCSYFGVGIGACIKNGKEVAEDIKERMVN
ncbi:oxygen-dependent protoporphyrinogen oxidase [Bacillus mesophilus]|uniref:Coproporphyrinogen III oxidase n=1 Tax=Bacillus mesophilus TaxID=1808955 RepID=A0A6M0Q3J8_9BACI|nr:protoporphyrinogen oxidase [Bacillus mesophilus]MBM7659874.1 oxygen-dependent protoporphyrinogen oxidase [Bacillus mesophilus]NEY70733.1 protoporphyrinogen oxidase [Bacillus mesophilus]